MPAATKSRRRPISPLDRVLILTQRPGGAPSEAATQRCRLMDAPLAERLNALERGLSPGTGRR
jgi:hypothetical protein